MTLRRLSSISSSIRARLGRIIRGAVASARIPGSFAFAVLATASLTTTLLLGTAVAAAGQDTDDAAGQQTDEPAEQQIDADDGDDAALTVFLDCQTYPCDSRYFRTEIDFVNWARNREDSDVHVIVTSQGLGGGARQFRVDFIGRGELQGVEDELTYNQSTDATEDETLAGVTRILSIGLARYASLAGATGDLRVVGNGAGGGNGGGAQGQAEDPWDFWILNLGSNFSYEAEDRQSSWQVRGQVSADRTTERWKLRVNLDGRREEETFELADSTKLVVQENWGSRVRATYSLADHWSLAGEAGMGASTFVNQDFNARLGAGIEYSLFPYPEATRRQLTARWILLGRRFDYEELTLFDQLSETRPQHLFEIALDFRQPWGDAGLDIESSQYLHDASKNRLTVDGDMQVRVYRGLSLRFQAQWSRIRDQLFLPAEDLSDEDVLVQRRQLATDYEFEFRTGFSFSFGSIYNNVVNNRFQRGSF